jgi:hypothetical protein
MMTTRPCFAPAGADPVQPVPATAAQPILAPAGGSPRKACPGMGTFRTVAPAGGVNLKFAAAGVTNEMEV